MQLPIWYCDHRHERTVVHGLQAALADTHIPQVSVVEAEGDHGDDPELDIDEDPDNVMRLDVAGLPLLVTVGQVRGNG